MNTEKKRKCHGCGLMLHTNDVSHVGYLPASALKRELTLCRRCYRIRHYGEISPVEQDADLYLQKLAQIAYTRSLVVHIIDLFDFSGSWIPGIHRHIGQNPLLILANKIDLFPKSTKWTKVREWIYRSMKDMGIYPVDVMLCSAANGKGMDQAIETINKHRQDRNTYIIGTTNTGKSTFINRLIHCLDKQGENNVITTSPYPGTTLDTIYIPLENGKSIIDTPGIVKKDRFSEWMNPAELKMIVPSSTVRPRIYQLNEKQTLFFGGLIRFDFIQGLRQSFVIYLSNRLYIHRTKLEQADAFEKKHRGQLLAPPQDPTILPLSKEHRFQLSGKMKIDIVISGLGWIACGKEKAIVKIWAPEGIQVITRSSVI